MADSNTARVAARLRTLAGVRRPVRRRCVVVAAALLALALVVGWAGWAGTHRSAAATAVPSRAVLPLSPTPERGPAAEAETPLAGSASQPGGGAPRGNALPAEDGPPLTDGQPGNTVEPPLPPTVAPTASMTVRFRPSTRWDGGMVGYFAITNTTGLPVTGWRLVITVPADLMVTATWEATMHRVGNTITFTSTHTSARVDVGTTVRFGLQATAKGGYNLPLTCMINDAQCA
jgi:cellulase/cellobiase CelA1